MGEARVVDEKAVAVVDRCAGGCFVGAVAVGGSLAVVDAVGVGCCAPSPGSSECP